MGKRIDFTWYGKDFCEIRLHDGRSAGCERMSGNPHEIGRMVFQRMDILEIPYDAPVFAEGRKTSKTIGDYVSMVP